MAYAAASNSEAESAPDLSRFLYDFDVDNQWSHFRHGPPTASSVERGRRKTRFKMGKGTLQGSKHRQEEKMPPIPTLTRSIWSAATVDVF